MLSITVRCCLSHRFCIFIHHLCQSFPCQEENKETRNRKVGFAVTATITILDVTVKCGERTPIAVRTQLMVIDLLLNDTSSS
ncbi:hypothetical protein MtrunA17_Chr6g0473951 [Medicago truncatula]|uniref:Uncharacterized protein n=1 Tax=Medicago truncatula TaxID=3880 RepID=A0A396HEV7_MEDTR|nr:hypothetical protein MtrunA17_Chr6g0473951 [Medicago truncatula]